MKRTPLPGFENKGPSVGMPKPTPRPSKPEDFEKAFDAAKERVKARRAERQKRAQTLRAKAPRRRS